MAKQIKDRCVCATASYILLTHTPQDGLDLYTRRRRRQIVDDYTWPDHAAAAILRLLLSAERRMWRAVFSMAAMS
jgi:hypothetical protein